MGDDYNPADHRHVKHPTNYFETMLHMIKASIGTGILAMPKGFSYSGYVIGVFGTAILGLLCVYCLRTLASVQYEMCKRRQVPSMTYAETAVNSFQEGPESIQHLRFIGWLPQLFVLGFQIGAAVIYLIFVSNNVAQVIENYFNIKIEVKWYMLIIMILFLLLALVNDLKHLAIFSFAADISTLIAFCILFYYLLRDVHGIEHMNPIGTWHNYGLFVATVVFAMEAIGVVLPLENEMKNPKKFTSTFGVLNMSLFPTTVLYTCTGFFGYLKYGNDAAGSVTLNLPMHETLAQVCKILISFAIFITYGLALFVAYDIIWKSYLTTSFPDETRCLYLYQYLLRVVLILFTFICAIAVPSIELVISLVGALCLATAGIAFPAMFNLFCYWKTYSGGEFVAFLLWCLFIVFVGIIICIIGVTISVSDILQKFYL